jgi:hypothetical protein
MLMTRAPGGTVTPGGAVAPEAASDGAFGTPGTVPGTAGGAASGGKPALRRSISRQRATLARCSS